MIGTYLAWDRAVVQYDKGNYFAGGKQSGDAAVRTTGDAALAYGGVRGIQTWRARGAVPISPTGITESGIQQIEKHLSRLELNARNYPPNAAMIERLRAGHGTPEDLNFYNHELLENELMNEGIADRAAHLRTLELQGVPYEAGYESQLTIPM